MTLNRLILMALFSLAAMIPISARSQEPWILGLAGTETVFPSINRAIVLKDGSTVILFFPSIPVPSGSAGPALLLNSFDRHGNLRWSKKLLDTDQIVTESISLLALQDGTFLLFLHIEGTFPPDCGLNVWGARLTGEGEILWQRYFSMYDIWWELTAFQTGSGRAFLTSGGGELDELNLATGEILWEKVYWVIPPDGWAQGLSLHGIGERAEGGISLWGGFWWTHSIRDHRDMLLTLDGEGNLLWHRDFKQQAPWDCAGLVTMAADGGFWISGWAEYWPETEPDPQHSWPWVMRLDAEGHIVWQRAFGDDNWSGSFYEPSVGIAGNLKASGRGGMAAPGQPDCHGALFATISPEGEVLDGRTYCIRPEVPYSAGWIQGLMARPDGGYTTWGGYKVTDTRLNAALYALDAEGNLPSSCTSYLPYPGVHQETSMAEEPVELFTADSSASQTCPTTVIFDSVDDIGAAMEFCGEPYPGVLSVVKLQNPFRLKLTGWNFEEGSKILINGMEAPNTHYKGEVKNGNGRRKLLAGGNGLKALLPKGQPVTITVLNPDGRESVGFVFVR